MTNLVLKQVVYEASLKIETTQSTASLRHPSSLGSSLCHLRMRLPWMCTNAPIKRKRGDTASSHSLSKHSAMTSKIGNPHILLFNTCMNVTIKRRQNQTVSRSCSRTWSRCMCLTHWPRQCNWWFRSRARLQSGRWLAQLSRVTNSWCATIQSHFRLSSIQIVS